jgi:paraquat-inducible protein A
MMATQATLHALARPADRRLVGPLLFAASACLAAGVTLPSMTVSTFPLLSDSISVLGGLGVLWGEGEYALFAILLVFSVLFPALKLAVGLWAWYGAPGSKALALVHVLERFGRWSMLDVFVVALAVAGLNLNLIAGVFVHAGVYLFTLSVLLSMIALGRLSHTARAALRISAR